MKVFENRVTSVPKADYSVSFGQGAAYAAGMLMVNLLANAINSALNKKKNQEESD